MRFIKIIVVLAICVVAVGFYRGWFTLSSHGRDTGSNKVDVNLTIDPDKAKDDVIRVKDKSAEIGNRASFKLTTEEEQEDAMKYIDESYIRTTYRG